MKHWAMVVLFACGSDKEPAPLESKPAAESKPAPQMIDAAVDAPAERPLGPEDVSFDASKCEPGTKLYRAVGMGSYFVHLIGLDKTACVYEATTEVEGGYTVSQCRVRADGVVILRAKGAMPAELVGECTRIRSGNIFQENRRGGSAK